MKKQILIVGIVIILLVTGLSGCNEQTQETSNPMIITNFNVTPPIILSDEVANLTWDVTGATTVSIDLGIGDVGLTGYRIIIPTQSTEVYTLTYTLTATNATTSLTATTQISVIPAPGAVNSQDKNLPIIHSFTVTPTLIEIGETANLTWDVTGATTVSINNGIGNVALSGSYTIIPTETKTYTITASNLYGETNASILIPIFVESGGIETGSTSTSTPVIHLNPDAAANKLIVAFAIDVSWSDIAITNNNTAAKWAVYTRFGATNSSTTPTEDMVAGDYIFVWGTTGNVKFTLRYIPANTVLGNWTINI